MIQIEEQDKNTIKEIVSTYRDISEMLENLQKELEDITYRRKMLSEKLKIMEDTEKSFIDIINKKYCHEFTTTELYEIINNE